MNDQLLPVAVFNSLSPVDLNIFHEWHFQFATLCHLLTTIYQSSQLTEAISMSERALEVVTFFNLIAHHSTWSIASSHRQGQSTVTIYPCPRQPWTVEQLLLSRQVVNEQFVNGEFTNSFHVPLMLPFDWVNSDRLQFTIEYCNCGFIWSFVKFQLNQ